MNSAYVRKLLSAAERIAVSAEKIAGAMPKPESKFRRIVEVFALIATGAGIVHAIGFVVSIIRGQL
ncbi:MAG: hypothetical protein LBG72_00235 [Spirochaetaceae bacterium]|jgi:hypothetical protein|nr:hypothetical protein [Spirochaetaceae bacterium]